jgi:CO/xanthine dehydrogenase FAD-binding subunit
MKPASFDYVAPESLEAAVQALVSARGDGKVMAGGQSLMPLLNFRMARPTIIVDLLRIPRLASIKKKSDTISIGALARHTELEFSDVIAANLPVMAAAMPHVAHLAIRNCGTIGGSLSHADPAAELPMLAVLYGASIKAQGPAGCREISAEEFFVSALTNRLEPEEIVFEIDFPVLKGHTGWAFEEVARRFGDFALASIAVSFTLSEGRIADSRVAVMGVADTPLRLREAEEALNGATGAAEDRTRFAEVVRASVSPADDIHVSGKYRKYLIGGLAEKAIAAAWSRAVGEAP